MTSSNGRTATHWSQKPENKDKVMARSKKSSRTRRKNGKHKKSKTMTPKTVSPRHQFLVDLALIGAQVELNRIEARRIELSMFVKGVR